MTTTEGADNCKVCSRPFCIAHNRTPSPEAVGEAVAFMYSRPSVHGGMREIVTITRDPMMVEHGWTQIPLYRHPVAADRALAFRLDGHSGKVPKGQARDDIREAADLLRGGVHVASDREALELLQAIIRCDEDGGGLLDCLDNFDESYQSADLARVLTDIRRFVALSPKGAGG